MKKFKYIIVLVAVISISFACSTNAKNSKALAENTEEQDTKPKYKGDKVILSESEWKKKLSNFEFYVLRESGTEKSFSGDFWDHHDSGIYTCKGCGLELFDSSTKFESGTGWPSYYQPLNSTHVGEKRDYSHGGNRVEVVCNRCDGHLGHVFNDGPKPTGLRYCINSASLDFVKK